MLIISLAVVVFIFLQINFRIQLDTQNGLSWIALSDINGEIDIWASSFTVDVTGDSYHHAFADTNGDGRIDIIQIEKNGISGRVGLNK